MIQRNTLLFWSMILLSIIVTLTITRYFKIEDKQPKFSLGIEIGIGFLIYNIIFWIHEYLYFVKHITIRSEKEALQNAYDWFDNSTHPDNFDTKRGDLSEGMYNENYDLTAEESMQQKYKTYFDYLNLSSGKTIVDLGCGYGHWLKYCRSRGVIVKGVTLSEPQKKNCEDDGLDIVLDDYRNFVLTTDVKYDAVSAIGSQEHLASMGMTAETARDIYNEMLRNIHRILKPTGKALVTIMLMNPEYPKWKISDNTEGRKNEISFKDKIHIYNLTCFYGCGRYPITTSYLEFLNNCFNVKKIKNYTEDYRWAGINFGDHHWQNSKLYINTPQRFIKTIQYLLTDPWFFGRINYSLMKSWYWQFGGTQKTPIYNNTKSPIISNIYVLEPKPIEECTAPINPDALKVN